MTDYKFIIDPDVEITQIGYSVCKTNWGIMNRKLPENELIIVFKGLLYCDIDNTHYEIHEGDACIIPKNTNSSHYTLQEDCSFYYAHFTGDLSPLTEETRAHEIKVLEESFLSPTLQELSLPRGVTSRNPLLILSNKMKCGYFKEEIWGIFSKALIERNNINTGRLLLISFYIYHILILLSRCYLAGFIKTRVTSQSQQRIIQKALLYIDENYTTEIDIKKLSDKLNISQQYLSHVFRKEMGISPRKYINSYRIKKAKDLLADSDLNISEVAFQLGFTNQYYFSRIFKQIEGISPSVYRMWLNSKSNL